MGTSGNPSKKAAAKAAQAEALKISQIGDFKKRMGGIIELPSGFIVKVKNPGGMQAFMTGGLIPNSLMGVVQKGLDTGGRAEMGELTNAEGGIDPEIMADMIEMLDRVAIKVIVQPTIHPKLTMADVEAWNAENPKEILHDPSDLKSDDLLYVDELPDDDKMFIFQWVSGGTTDLKDFRRRQQAGVDASSAVTGNSAFSE